MIPFMEKILRDYLFEQEGVVEIVDTRIGTKKPGTLDEPWICISTIDDSPAGRSSVDHNVSFYVQLDCYSGEKGSAATAILLGRTVRQALGGLVGEREEAIVSGLKVTGSRRLVDDSLTPAVDRAMVTATIWAHSAEGAGGS